MENEQRVMLLAEEVQIDENRSNDIFLLISFKLFDNQKNQNRQGVTAAFISEMINNVDKYVSLPLYVDVPRQLERDYANLTHLFDPVSGRFYTTQIGGIVDFRTEMNNDGVVSLYGTARVPKREIDICERLAELYEMGQLNFSFEITYDPVNTVTEDGVTYVDAGENNHLTGMAVVSVPACPDASAQEMVASVASDATEIAEVNEVKETMPEEKIMANETEEVKQETEVAEAEQAEQANAEATATAENAEAEVVHEHVVIRESIDKDCWDDQTYHTVETEHVVVETVEATEEPAAAIAETVEEPEEKEEKEDDRDREIAELKQRIAELEIAEAELNKLKAEKAEAEHAAKVEKAKAFASKQGLDLEDEAVKNAIAELNYEAIADLAEANAAKENKEPEMTMASFIDMEPTGKYGGLLDRR